MLDRPRTTYFKLMDLYAAAPSMPLDKAVRIAERWADEEIKAFDAQSALAVLTELLGFNSHGAIPAKFKDVRDAQKWALQKVSYCHSWVVCGPVSDGLESLQADIERNVRIEHWSTAEPE
jgi:hypothetical protein